MRNIVIVGGNAVGMSCASRLGRINQEDKIIVLEKGHSISYSNCTMPYYLGGVVEDRSSLNVTNATELEEKYGLDIRNYHEVVRIDREANQVLVKNHTNLEEYTLDYDVLVLGLGAKATIIPFEGLDQATNAFSLSHVWDVDTINDYMITNKPQHVTIVGAGPIGIELAENFTHKGLKVTVLDMAKQILNAFDMDIAQIAEKELKAHGVDVRIGTSIQKIEEAGKKLTLTDESSLETDMIIMAIGVKANVEIAKEAGLEIGEFGGIVVDEYNRTSDKEIYAGGDCAETNNRITQNNFYLALGGPANRHGRLIANHIMGDRRGNPGSLASAVLKVFDKTVASTGLSHKQALKEGYDALAVHIVKANHSKIYPGAQEITYKLIFDRDTRRVLGAQAVGGEGTEKRIDTTAVVLAYDGEVDDLVNLDITYAPPFNSNKDHLNIAGQVAQNILDEVFIPFYPKDIKRVIKEGINVIDVRPQAMYQDCKCNIPGSVNLPFNDLEAQLDKIDFSKPVFITCNEGITGYRAALMLKRKGFEQKIYNLSGGMKFYESVKK